MDRMRAFVLFCSVGGAASIVLKSNHSAAPPTADNGLSVLKQSRQDGQDLSISSKLTELKAKKEGCMANTWYMTSTYYWGCVEFVNYEQFLCHYTWKQIVASSTGTRDFLDDDDVAECGKCTMKKTKWGVDPYLDETKYYMQKDHPFSAYAMKYHFPGPFEFDPNLEICSTSGKMSEHAMSMSFLRLFMKCIKRQAYFYMNFGPERTPASDMIAAKAALAACEGGGEGAESGALEKYKDHFDNLVENATKAGQTPPVYTDHKEVGGAVLLQNSTTPTNLIASKVDDSLTASKVDDSLTASKVEYDKFYVDKQVEGTVLLQNTTNPTNLIASKVDDKQVSKVDDKQIGAAVLLQNSTNPTKLTA